MIGSYRGAHIQVRDCTVPLRRDVRRTHLFDRKDQGHHLAANSAWTSSSGTETYVGEWHTHPEDFPTPSSTDLRTWSEIMGRHTLPVVFLIAGRRDIWAGIGQGGRVERMHRVPAVCEDTVLRIS
ncbi:Mov34/MPN/PAD-1 family protein [Bradyrhizobium sp. BRP14]|nr:Mov34/MPN/PAD-1 family protein [Bradyrhizobium sp. BRP14]